MVRTADEQNESLKEGGNFGAVTSSLHYSLLFPHTLFRLLWVSFSLIFPLFALCSLSYQHSTGVL